MFFLMPFLEGFPEEAFPPFFQEKSSQPDYSARPATGVDFVSHRQLLPEKFLHHAPPPFEVPSDAW